MKSGTQLDQTNVAHSFVRHKDDKSKCHFIYVLNLWFVGYSSADK